MLLNNRFNLVLIVLIIGIGAVFSVLLYRLNVARENRKALALSQNANPAVGGTAENSDDLNGMAEEPSVPGEVTYTTIASPLQTTASVGDRFLWKNTSKFLVQLIVYSAEGKELLSTNVSPGAQEGILLPASGTYMYQFGQPLDPPGKIVVEE